MKTLLVIAGTADAADFIESVPQGHRIVATTISKLGEDCIPPRAGLRVVSGALEEKGFSLLMEKESVTHVVDMSHPFAAEVSKNVFAAAQSLSLPYYRFQRDSLKDAKHCLRCKDFPTAVETVKSIKGNLLLTIGSRNLRYFTALPDFSERCYVRVLASSKILLELEEMGVDPSRIFAMKGVATKELNIALAHAVNAAAIVTKDSGLKGGLAEKYAAAEELGIPLVVIERPPLSGKAYTNFYEILEEIGRD